MKDPRGVVSVLLLSVLVFRPHLSGGTYPFAQELLLIPLLVGLGLWLLVPHGCPLRREDLRSLVWPWLLVIWAGVTLLWAPDPGQGVRDTASLALNLSAFTAVYLLGRNPNWLDRGVAWLSGLVVLPVLTFAFYQRVFGFEELRALLAGMSAAGDDVSGLMGVISQGRVFAGFLNPNMLAGFLAVVIPVSLDYALTVPNRRSAALYSALVLSEAGILLLTGSVGGTLVAVMAGGGVLLARRGARSREVMGMGAIAVVLAAGLLAIRGLGPIFGPESSFSQRAGYMAAGTRMALEHPILGWGAGSSPGALMGFVAQGVRPVSDPHNFLVRIWIEGGTVGLVLIGGFLWLLTGKSLDVIRTTGLKTSPVGFNGLLFGSAAFLLHSLMDMDFFVPETALFGWGAMGGLLALSMGHERREPDDVVPLPLRQTMGGVALFAVLPVLLLLQGESLAFRGLKMYQAGQHAAAADLYREAGKLLPFNGRIALEEGRARFTAGERAQALELFERADRLMAMSPYPPWELGRTAQAEARWNESLPYLERASFRYPTSPRILIDLARSHLNMGDPVPAADYLEKALAASAFDPPAGELARNLLDRMR
ncbi:MAG: O-antigen ligase family protein [bacterium]|nr:O-antigen ligase family protein [bacterium]